MTKPEPAPPLVVPSAPVVCAHTAWGLLDIEWCRRHCVPAWPAVVATYRRSAPARASTGATTRPRAGCSPTACCGARGCGPGRVLMVLAVRSRRADPPPFVDVRAARKGRRSTMCSERHGLLGVAGSDAAARARRAGCRRRAADRGPVRRRRQGAGATGRPHPRLVRRRDAVRSFTRRSRATRRLPTPRRGAGSASLPACRDHGRHVRPVRAAGRELGRRSAASASRRAAIPARRSSPACSISAGSRSACTRSARKRTTCAARRAAVFGNVRRRPGVRHRRERRPRSGRWQRAARSRTVGGCCGRGPSPRFTHRAKAAVAFASVCAARRGTRAANAAHGVASGRTMCLAVIALDAHPRYALVIAANRDEFHARAAERAHWWKDQTGHALLAGRDVPQGGTWLGVNRLGRWAFVTNVREPGRHDPQAPSRGALVPRVLRDAGDAAAAVARIAATARGYNGFNLVAGGTRRQRSPRTARRHLVRSLPASAACRTPGWIRRGRSSFVRKPASPRGW